LLFGTLILVMAAQVSVQLGSTTALRVVEGEGPKQHVKAGGGRKCFWYI